MTPLTKFRKNSLSTAGHQILAEFHRTKKIFFLRESFISTYFLKNKMQ